MGRGTPNTPSPQKTTIWGYPVELHMQIGGQWRRVPGAIRNVSTQESPGLNYNALDYNALADFVADQTRPCDCCGTKPGGIRRG